jgi:UDP-N-acetylglucosamine diphosphorylase / glucose-1-phosphate thymidylyltransferase / UDP-N-acetylgalactosamine diphosphorylase / glucosamine-1-phosphate N-acetyltransferase / galactosamine-1-phosphate N-acetyltransferase
MRALILAAGKGRNLSSLTETRPKSMIRLCDKPLLEYIILNIREIGITDFTIVIGHKMDTIIEYFGRGESYGIKLEYIKQEKQTGIGDAVLLAQNRFPIEEHFILAYSDILTSGNIFKNCYKSFNSLRTPIASIVLTPDAHQYGNIYMDDAIKIAKIIEKPKRTDVGNYVLAGSYILPGDFFKILNESKGDMEKAFNLLLSLQGLSASIWDDEWIDISYPWNILTANKINMDVWKNINISTKAKIEGYVSVNGPVWVDDDAVIKSGAVLEGPCYIGKKSYVGNNALIRKYTSLGKNTVVGYGVEIKNSILFGNSWIGRLSFIGDSVIGEGVKIGSNTVTVNEEIDRSTISVEINDQIIDSKLVKLGSFIGDHSNVGASNTLLPGTFIHSNQVIPHKGTLSKKGM